MAVVLGLWRIITFLSSILLINFFQTKFFIMTDVVTSKVGKYKTVEQASEFIRQNLSSPTAARSVTSFLSAKARAGEHLFLNALMESMAFMSEHGTYTEEQAFRNSLDVFGELLNRYIKVAESK